MARAEQGQVLGLALIAMIVGAVVLGGLLTFASTGLKDSAVTSDNLQAYYAAEAGVEDAIWKVRYGDLSSSGLGAAGNSTIYSLGQPLNGLTVTVSVTRIKTDIALDDFESAMTSGGAGWVGPWTAAGTASWVKTGIPYRGSYHLRLTRTTGYVERGVDLTGLSGMRLQFWAKAANFLQGETVELKIGPAGSLNTAKSWTYLDSDNAYKFYDFDISSYAMSSDFRVAFQAGMTQNRGDFFIDNVQFVRALPGSLFGLPVDDFETGNTAGGSGWLLDWANLGDAGVVNTGGPHGGAYHLQLRKGNGVATRRADLLGLTYLRAQFWTNAMTFPVGGTANFQVSSDGQVWDIVKTWTEADADGVYRFNDVDLSPFAFSKPFYVRFASGMSTSSNYFFVDDFAIVGPAAYDILSTAGTFPIRAMVVVRGPEVVVLSWKVG